MANAAAFAKAKGRPLNAMLTITWRETPLFSEDKWSRLQTRLMDKLTRHLRRHGVETAFVWARERVTGIGAHTHVLLHLGTAPKAMKRVVLDYLRQAFGFSRDGVHISMGDFGANTPESQAGLLLYVTKGIDHAAFRYVSMAGDTENFGVALGIRHRGQQGIIEIKRAGTSQNIGAAARQKTGWAEIRDLAGLYRVLNPEVRAQGSCQREDGRERRKHRGKRIAIPDAPCISASPRRTAGRRHERAAAREGRRTTGAGQNAIITALS